MDTWTRLVRYTSLGVFPYYIQKNSAVIASGVPHSLPNADLPLQSTVQVRRQSYLTVYVVYG